MKKEQKLDLEILKQIFNSGEIYLIEVIKATDAIERKATIFLSVFISLATAAIGIALKGLESNSRIVFCFFICLSIGSYVATYFLIKALKPHHQYLVGNHPNNLIESAKQKNYTLQDLLLEESANYQDMIEYNSKVNRKKSKYINYGLNSILLTIVVSILTTLIVISSCGVQ